MGISRYDYSVGVNSAESELSVAVTEESRFFVPRDGFGGIAPDSPAVLVVVAQIELRAGMSLACGLPIPFKCLGRIALNTLPFTQAKTHAELRLG